MGTLIAERRPVRGLRDIARFNRADSNAEQSEANVEYGRVHPALFDLASGLEPSRYPLVILSAGREAVYANAVATERIGVPGGWSAAPFSAELGGDRIDESMNILDTWTRRMGNRLKRKGPWPREIVVRSGLCKGTWLASRLTIGTEDPIGVLITGTCSSENSHSEGEASP